MSTNFLDIPVDSPDDREGVTGMRLTRLDGGGYSVPADQLPDAVCAVVGDVLGRYIFHHQTIDKIFFAAGARQPIPEGTCARKATAWLMRLNKEHSNPCDALGSVLKTVMDDEPSEYDEKLRSAQEEITGVLAQHGMRYERKGRILPILGSLPTRDLAAKLRERDLPGIEEEFSRALGSIGTDARAAVTAACSILEALFKTYLEDERQPFPSDQSVGPLWKEVRKHMKIAPDDIQDDDLRKVVGGLSSVVDGVGAFRTHAGSAHGGGRTRRAPEEHEARLTVHAAHAVVAFLLDHWAQQRGRN